MGGYTPVPRHTFCFNTELFFTFPDTVACIIHQLSEYITAGQRAADDHEISVEASPRLFAYILLFVK